MLSKLASKSERDARSSPVLEHTLSIPTVSVTTLQCPIPLSRRTSGANLGNKSLNPADINLRYATKKLYFQLMNLLVVLDETTKLRKAIISFVIPVCPSVRMEQLGYHWTDFHEI